MRQQQMNQPTQAILQKYGISPIPNPQQSVSGNAQVRNNNSNIVNNQIHNKIIIIQPQIPIAQPNVQIKSNQGENVRNYISNQFKAQQQKYQEENNFYKKYGEKLTNGIQKVTKSVTNATQRFAENINPQKLSKTMTDSKRVLILMALSIMAAKFIGPLTNRIDKFYTWFVGDGKENKGFIQKFKDIFFSEDRNKGILNTFKKGISYGFSLIKGYLKLAVNDRVRALSELKNQDLKNVKLFSITDVPALIAKTFAALIGGSKALSWVKTRSAGRKLKKKIIEEVWQNKHSDIKNEFDQFGNVKSEFSSVQKVQKKIEELIQKAFKDHYKLWISIPHVLSLLEALKNATFTCYQTDGKLVRGTIINNARNFLIILGYYDSEIKQLFEQNHVVDVKSIVIDKNKSKEISGCQVIIEEGWRALAFFFGAEDVSISDKKYYDTFEQRLLERWKAYWKDKLKGNEKALSHLESVNKTSDAWNTYDKELKELKRAWEFEQELNEAKAVDNEIFERENREALDFFRNLKESIFGDDRENLEQIDEFNEKNYVQSDGNFNTENASKEIQSLSYKRFDEKSRFEGYKTPKERTGHCAKHVRMAIENGGGISLAGNPREAYQYLSFLPKKGFKLIHSGRKRDLENPNVYPFPNDLRQGDVVVFDKTDGHKSGHIAMYDGNNWYSDYLQNTWHGTDGGFDAFGVFRFSNSSGDQSKTTDEYLKQTENAVRDENNNVSNQEKLRQMTEAQYYKKSDTLPESAAPYKTTTTTAVDEKDLGTLKEKSPVTSNPPKSTVALSEGNPESSRATYDEPTDDLSIIADSEVSINNYARKGSAKQRVIYNTMRASYIREIKK